MRTNDARRGLGIDDSDASFAKAVAALRRQIIARGGDGTLRDVVCFLSEDGRSALLAANWGSSEPVTANFMLPAVTSEDEFDADVYIERAMAEATNNT